MFSFRLIRCVLALCVAILMANTVVAENRVALVIGNSQYSGASYLPNAVQDAQDVSAALRQLGFDVHDGYDLNRIEMLKLTQRVTKSLQADDVAVFYFSGHAVQLGAENFILPVDVAGQNVEELKSASVSLQSVLREMELRADRNIIILDACRNNPFQGREDGRSIRGQTRGLARVDAGVGSYIAFSTQPGNVALDGQGRNSPFTGSLVRHLKSENDDLHEMMRKVRSDVVDVTNGSQIPWENSSLIEKVFLSQPSGRIANEPSTPPIAVTLEPTGAVVPAVHFTHQVSGLDPNGDGFLALREGTFRGAARIAKMGEGTPLRLLGQDGAWYYVQTQNGLLGWAHSNWIRGVGGHAVSAQTLSQCDALWYQRNVLFHQRGFCFKSARGKASFSNARCNPVLTAQTTPLSAAERSEVARLNKLEQSLGCR